MTTQPPVLAVFNSSEDILELLRILFESEGFVVVTGHVSSLRRGDFDLRDFVEQHRPAAVLYDLMPPYEQQWRFLDHLRVTSPLKDIPFVVTSTNAKAAREIAARDEPVIEILGRPFDLDELLAAVRRVIGEGLATS